MEFASVMTGGGFDDDEEEYSGDADTNMHNNNKTTNDHRARAQQESRVARHKRHTPFSSSSSALQRNASSYTPHTTHKRQRTNNTASTPPSSKANVRDASSSSSLSSRYARFRKKQRRSKSKRKTRVPATSSTFQMSTMSNGRPIRHERHTAEEERFHTSHTSHRSRVIESTAHNNGKNDADDDSMEEDEEEEEDLGTQLSAQELALRKRYASIRRLGQRWSVVKYLGQGAYGAVLSVRDTRPADQRRSILQHEDMFAAKVELSSVSPPQLDFEMNVFRALQKMKPFGFPMAMDMGTTSQYRYVVMQLLGKSMKQLAEECAASRQQQWRHSRRASSASSSSASPSPPPLHALEYFSTKTTWMVADQMISRMEAFHKMGFLHRDIKPENILMGHPKSTLDAADPHRVYLIDYGMTGPWRVERHFRYRGTPPIKLPPTSSSSSSTSSCTRAVYHLPDCESEWCKGTILYMPCATHNSRTQSRRDDMESLLYVMVHLWLGKLPWYNNEGPADGDPPVTPDSIARIKQEFLYDDGARKWDAFLRRTYRQQHRDEIDRFVREGHARSKEEAVRVVVRPWMEWVIAAQTMRFTEEPPYRALRASLHAAARMLDMHFQDCVFDWSTATG